MLYKRFPRCARSLCHFRKFGGRYRESVDFQKEWVCLAILYQKCPRCALDHYHFIEQSRRRFVENWRFAKEKFEFGLHVMLPIFPRFARGLYHLLEAWRGKFGEKCRFNYVWFAILYKISALRVRPLSSHRKMGVDDLAKIGDFLNWVWIFHINIFRAARAAFFIW